MAISTGGIAKKWGEPCQALSLMNVIGKFAPPADGDHFVEIALRSWHDFREPEFHGVEAAIVGRKQRRFIMWHSVE